jgi:hypothetical protein
MVELYLHSPIRLHDVVLNEAQGPYILLYQKGVSSSTFLVTVHPSARY